jgi:hypothetical protein
MKLKKMKNIKTLILFLIAGIFLTANANSENFFAEAKKKYDEKSFEKSKFLFQRNLVYNPKDAKSYLYLAKIFANEENEIEQIKNINTTLLLEPDNEEAMFILIEYELKKSNYSKVNELKESFILICNKLCNEKKNIEKLLKDIEPKNESE